jgi:hypothetical protein
VGVDVLVAGLLRLLQLLHERLEDGLLDHVEVHVQKERNLVATLLVLGLAEGDDVLPALALRNEGLQLVFFLCGDSGRRDMRCAPLKWTSLTPKGCPLVERHPGISASPEGLGVQEPPGDEVLVLDADRARVKAE